MDNSLTEIETRTALIVEAEAEHRRRRLRERAETVPHHTRWKIDQAIAARLAATEE